MSRPVDRIEIEDINFAYTGETSALWQGLSLYFQLNKLNLVVGQSGCGKSSLLYLLNGLIPHFLEGNITGKLYYGNDDRVSIPPNLRAEEISLVFQDPEAQFVTFTVECEVAFGLENICVPKEKIGERIEEALSFTRIADLRERNLSELSGGEKQKVAIACALAMDSPIIAMDEPTANLDLQSRREIFELIRRLVKSKNKTVILVEHNISEIIAFVSHFIILRADRTLEMQGNYNQVEIALKKFYPFLSAEDAAADETSSAGACFHGNYKYGRREILGFDKVSFCYDDRKPLFDNLSCSVARGDFVFLTGANGAGKSTLVSLLFRVLSGYTGAIRFDNKRVESIPKQELYGKLGWVFQNPEWQFVTNSVFEEMMFSLKNTRSSDAEKERKITNTLKRFRLYDECEKSPFLLSQGQKRRLSVAMMLLTNQEMLILDEPTYGQDYENSLELMDMMMELNREGVTILMITHDDRLLYEYPKRYADKRAFRHIHLENGKITEKYAERREGVRIY
jgi:energy-coupling factor transport system ATP-binding protein